MLSNFIFQSPTDIAFNFFGIDVYFYGIIMAFAILIGYFVAYNLFKRYYDSEKAKYITDFSPYLILIGIIGARLYYCCVNYIFSKIYKIKFSQLADVFMCGSILAQSIGRWGNFFNSEAFGTPTDLPWKLYISPSHRPVEYLNFEYFHPTFLYESILDFLIFIILLIFFKKTSKISGTSACICLALYSFARFFIEGIRLDSTMNIYGYHIAQIVSLVIIVLSCCLLICLYKKNSFNK